MICKNSTRDCENQLVSKPCENCFFLMNKVKYLLKTCARFTKGKVNLKVVFGSQNCIFGKVGIGCNSFFEKNIKKLINFFSISKSSDMSFIVRKCHVFKICNATKYDVSKGLFALVDCTVYNDLRRWI